MYIAFLIVHHDFRFVNSRHFQTIQKAIMNCVNDNHYVHIYFASRRNLHRYDKLFLHKNIELFHKTYNVYTTDIDVTRHLYHTMILDNDIDYHWMIKLRPDLIIFDSNIFVDMRTKYNPNVIHARLRYYIGPKKIKKNERSYYDHSSIIEHNTELLKLYDNQFYIIPYTLQYFAFKPTFHKIKKIEIPYVSNYSIIRLSEKMNNEFVPEKTQTQLWNVYNLPIQINEFNVVSIHHLFMYNNTFYN